LTEKVLAKNDSSAGPADTAQRYIDEFCHDIRNRLTIVREFASIIADGLAGPVSPAQREHLDTIIAAVERMAHMVDDLPQQHWSLDGTPADRAAAT